VNTSEKARFIETLLDSISGASQIINVPERDKIDQKRS
jgi:hypothetical protein